MSTIREHSSSTSCLLGRILLALLIASSLLLNHHSEAKEDVRQIRIGALFGVSDVIQRTSFIYAVESLNFDSRSVKFVPMLMDASPVDSLQVSHKACDLVLGESIAIFGPSTAAGLSHVRSVCEKTEIPHFMSAFDISNVDYSYSINLLPSPGLIGTAVHDLVRHYGWRRMIILYEDMEGLAMLQDVIQMSSSYEGPTVALKQLRNDHSLPGARTDYTPLLKHLKELLNENRIIVQADLESSRQLLSQAAAMGMVSEHYHYVFTDLDMSTLDLEPYKHSGCNITALRIIDYESPRTKALISGLRVALRRANSKSFLPSVGVQAIVAVIYDSVRLLSEAVADRLDSLRPTSLDCASDRSWVNGTSFINHLKALTYAGATGKIQLNGQGQRMNFNMTLVELTRDGFQELGVWNTSHGLTVTKNYTIALQQAAKSLEKQILRVVVYMEEPFVMHKESAEKLTGNDRYEGYSIDVLRHIADILQFNYTIHQVKDNAYGSADPVSKMWNGLVGELMNDQADLAVSALTISYGRSEVIDFTVPFMHLGISILFKKPDRKDPSLFSFLSPLSLDVWIYMLAAYLGVSLMLWVLARFSPYEWYNPHPCNPYNDVMENQFSLLNSLWFTVGSLMQQGSDLAPRAASTRLVAGVWWFFTLILISSYTANLAAFLTVERMVPQIESAEDLVKQTKIKYGSLNRGSTMAFFSESKIPTYERMWTVMRSTQPTVFVNSSTEGITRVRTGDYAYLMESAMLEYYVERDCNLTQVNGLIDSKGYGIGLPKGSIYRELLSSAILRLQEKAVLAELKNRWWKEKRGGGRCKDDGGKGQHNELGLQNVGGVFVALLCGLALALVIGIIEFMYKTAQNVDPERGTVCEAMWRDLKFALRCKGSKKHNVRRKSAPVVTGYFDDGAGALVPAFGVATASGYTALAARSLETLSPRNNR